MQKRNISLESLRNARRLENDTSTFKATLKASDARLEHFFEPDARPQSSHIDLIGSLSRLCLEEEAPPALNGSCRVKMIVEAANWLSVDLATSTEEIELPSRPLKGTKRQLLDALPDQIEVERLIQSMSRPSSALVHLRAFRRSS